MKIRTACLALAALLTATACTSTRAVMLGGTGTYPELSPTQVRVFLREADVPGDYERIALVTARSDASWADEADLVRAMRRRAARLGANGLILGEIRDPTTVERIAEVLTDYQPQRRGRAVAIRLLPPPGADARTMEVLTEMPLSVLRHARGLTQEQMARILGATQAHVSKLERRGNLQLSSLRRYVAAMGGELEIVARFPDGDVRLDGLGG